jgi:hypothetical protein
MTQTKNNIEIDSKAEQTNLKTISTLSEKPDLI